MAEATRLSNLASSTVQPYAQVKQGTVHDCMYTASNVTCVHSNMASICMVYLSQVMHSKEKGWFCFHLVPQFHICFYINSILP